MRAGCAVTSSVDVDELSSLYVQGRLLVGSTNSSRRFPITVIAPAGASLNEEESHYASRVKSFRTSQGTPKYSVRDLLQLTLI